MIYDCMLFEYMMYIYILYILFTLHRFSRLVKYVCFIEILKCYDLGLVCTLDLPDRVKEECLVYIRQTFKQIPISHRNRQTAKTTIDPQQHPSQENLKQNT